ncbi:hypothetical protein BDV41DRAFT_579277 [Aspergillus transmontanensis]|uniref:Aminoglycoside phosphotransferase domain-containing protein n=1 Tax=Aspergillus transmontanensis TaxID=1034304 RepID=A0A5N6VQ89_9EURO|nr:hypothetical protein BDV41DRAFT_579277 [Aspergillus transmontanensis]
MKALSQLIAHKDIPVPKVLRDWVDDNHRYFILEERVDGQTLEEAWPSLSTSQKALIADQVAEVRNQLKNITSPSIQSVDQGPCIPGLLFFDLEPRGSFHSDIELWNAIALTLHDPPRGMSISKRSIAAIMLRRIVIVSLEVRISGGLG